MKRLSLLAVSMLLTCTLFAADIFLRGSVNGWGASDDFKFATSDNVVYTLEKSFDLFGEFKFADANWGVDNYGSGGGAVELETPLKLVAGGSNFNCGSNSYKVTKIVLNLLENSATIYGEGGELEITSRTVAGDDTGIFGTAWDPENTANDMVKDGSTWKLVKENVSLVSGTEYLFKIVANHAWGVSDYPEDSSNASFTVSQSGAYDVNFEYDETTNTGKAYATKKSEPTTFDSYILVGDAALFVFDWMPSPMGTDMFTLETTDGIHYTKTVNGVPLNVTGTFAYGFSKNGSTTDILFKDKSKTVTIEEAATYNITVALTVAHGEEPDAKAELTKVTPGTTYYITGNGDAETDWCCGESWNPAGCAMESGYFTRDLPAGEYKFKITQGDWVKQSWGYDAVDAAQSTAGYTSDADGNVVFTLETLSAVAVKFDGSKIALQWTAKDEPVPGFDTWTLVGDMPPFPAAWTVEPAFDLQTTDGVVYTLVADDVDMTVDKFQYGFRKNHTEEYAPLAEKYTANLTEGTGNYKVEIALDFTDAADPKVEVQFTKKGEPVTYDYYIAGNGDAASGWACGIYWDAAGCGMTDGQYKAHVQPGTYEFKITNGKWATEGGKDWGVGAVDAIKSTPGYEGTDNVKFSVSSEANITVSFDGTSIILLSDVPFGEATITSWTAVGEAGLFENAWTPTDESNDMQFVGGVYQLVKTGLTLEAKDYLYKFTANHTWSVSEIPSGNATLTIEEAGTYKVTFSLNTATGKYSAVPEKQVDPGFDTWSLIGDMPPFPKSWTILPGFDLQTEDGKIYTLSAETEFTVTEFEYGFRKNHTDEYAPLAEKYTATLAEGTGEYKVDIALDFTDAAVPKVSVKFTKIPEPVVTGITVNVTVPDGTPACFFYGDMSGNTFVEMTKVDATHYTTKFADKESIGWGYLFCWESGNFSTKNTGGDFTDEPVDGVINVEVVGWETEPGTEYKYTTYTDWKVKSDWNGDWDTADWLTLTNVSDGVFEGEAAWGTGPGVNLGSESGPVKKDWYPAGDPALTIEEGLAVGQAVKITLTVVDDENVTINVADANPTSADEAVEDAIYANNGTVYCNAPFEIYNLVGQNVTSQNGTLNGVFIVKTANMVKTVLVK